VGWGQSIRRIYSIVAYDDEGKYVIAAEGIRIAFTNRNGGAPTNLWINDTNGNEIDILLGLDNVQDYDDYVGQLGGTIGMR
jgi:aldose 1-epimerase